MAWLTTQPPLSSSLFSFLPLSLLRIQVIRRTKCMEETKHPTVYVNLTQKSKLPWYNGNVNM